MMLRHFKVLMRITNKKKYLKNKLSIQPQIRVYLEKSKLSFGSP